MVESLPCALPAPAPVPTPTPATAAPRVWTAEEQRELLEDLARQLTGDRPRLRIMRRLRGLLGRLGH